MDLSPGGEPVDKKPTLNADGLIQTVPIVAASDQLVSVGQPSNAIGSNSVGSSVVAGANAGTLTVDQLDIEVLPVIYDIIRCVEKDPLDNAAKQRESQECSQKILELQKRFESARNQIKQLPGIDYNKEEQLQKLELLRNQLKLKQQLIRKYKDTQF